MDLLELGKQIAKLGAPLLGGAVGGPLGAGLAGIIASVVGGDPDDPEDLYQRIKADPEAAVKLREVELTHKTRLEEITLENTQSAREREVEVTKATGKLNWPMYVLAGVIVVGFFVLVMVLFFKAVPEGSREVAFMLFGSLATNFGAVCNYFFGSSKGSADKTNLMAGKKT